MIAFTIDIDWAPEEVIEDTLSLFEKYGIKCTIFSTHKSDILGSCNKDLFEIGIHPNFIPLLSGKTKSVDEVLDELLNIHPDAKGIRSHSMMQSTNLLNKFAEKKLVYDANHFLPYHKGVKPFMLWNGMVRIPYNWEDDIHWMYNKSFDSCGIDLNDAGLNVINFHPVHIYLNTENSDRYNKAKEYYKEPQKLFQFRNNKIKGTRDLFISLLEYVNKNKIAVKKLIEIADEFNAGDKS